jgi:hypothetical protein
VPPSRNVKLTLFSCCMAVLAWCHEQLAAMVRYGWWSRRREQLLSALIVSWAQNRERAHGAGDEHPPAGLLMFKVPLPEPSTSLQQGRSLRYCGHQLSATQTWKSRPKPPVRVACHGRRRAAILPMLHHYVSSPCSVAILHVLTRFTCPIQPPCCR